MDVMIERLSGDYIRGYTAALLDIMNVIKYIQVDLKHHKRRQSGKLYYELANCMLANRAILRDFFPDAFVRCNDKASGGFEVYIQKPLRR